MGCCSGGGGCVLVTTQRGLVAVTVEGSAVLLDHNSAMVAALESSPLLGHRLTMVVTLQSHSGLPTGLQVSSSSVAWTKQVLTPCISMVGMQEEQHNQSVLL